MFKKISLLLSLCFILQFAGTSAQAVEAGISIVVNDRMISELQVRDRMKLLMSSANIPNTAENRAKLLPQVTDMLINEALKLEEAMAEGIDVSADEIDSGIAQIAAQNKFSKDQFSSLLKSQGIPLRTLEDQIRSEVAWGKYVQKELRPQVDVSEYDIDAEIERLASNPKYANDLPDRDQVLNKIGNERLGRLQARHLMDLKASAFIESRG